MHPYQSHVISQMRMSELRREADLARRSTGGLANRLRRRPVRSKLGEWFSAFAIERPAVRGEQLVDVLLRVRQDGSRAWAVFDYEGDHFEVEGEARDDRSLPGAHLRREAAMVDAIDHLRDSLINSIETRRRKRPSLTLSPNN